MTDPAVATGAAVRVRFCPSPTGNPHVGMVRTALFNWAYARHTGGTFVFRIEDTDSARDSEQSYDDLLAALAWLHLDWDEGPEVGGPHEPYRQSERMRAGLYAEIAERLVAAGLAYESFSTPDEIAARRRAAGQDPQLGYDNADRDTSPAERERRLAAGERPVIRLRMPDEDLGWHDLVRKGDDTGRIVFKAGSVPDFVIVRGNGEPLYTLVNPVDDALMGITHVLRGEDLLSSTPRQLAMYAALAAIGVTDGSVPAFGHLPYVMGEGNRKLSKRDPQSSLNHYRDEGFLPEGLVNYLALLGWSIGDDREFFSLGEMAAAFDVADVNASPARFDYKKALAINADWVRALPAADLAARLVPFLQRDGVLPDEPSTGQVALLDAAVPLVQERMELLGQATGMLGFLFADAGPGSAPFALDPEAVAAVLTPEARPTLQAAHDALALLPEWSTPQIEAALRGALVEGLGLKPKLAFGPVRVAVSGRRVSPPLFESLELLGRDRSLARLTAALEA